MNVYIRLGLDWVEFTSLDFTLGNHVISTPLIDYLIDEVKTILVDFVGLSTMHYIVLPLLEFFQHELVYRSLHTDLLVQKD